MWTCSLEYLIVKSKPVVVVGVGVGVEEDMRRPPNSYGAGDTAPRRSQRGPPPCRAPDLSSHISASWRCRKKRGTKPPRKLKKKKDNRKQKRTVTPPTLQNINRMLTKLPISYNISPSETRRCQVYVVTGLGCQNRRSLADKSDAKYLL